MHEVQVRCEPEEGVVVSVTDDAQGVPIDALELSEPRVRAPAAPRHAPANALPLPEYLRGLREGVRRAVAERDTLELARFSLPLLTPCVPAQLDDAARETQRARQNLQRTLEVSDPARAEQLATARDRSEALVAAWRAELQREVDALCSDVSNAIKQASVAEGEAERVRTALAAEAKKLCTLASDLETGALRQVWEAKLRDIVDAELCAVLERVDSHALKRREMASDGLRPIGVRDLDLTEAEPLVARCRRCACRQHSLEALGEVRGTLLAHAAQLAEKRV